MRMPERPLAERAQEVYNHTYYAAVGNLNRKDRRTAYGRMLVAQAEAAALRAENEFLRSQLQLQEDSHE